jgi:hypothetical protein
MLKNNVLEDALMNTLQKMTPKWLNCRSIKDINKIALSEDESHLFPIRGRYNVTERAIKNLAPHVEQHPRMGGFEYALMLDGEISRLVNSTDA